MRAAPKSAPAPATRTTIYLDPDDSIASIKSKVEIAGAEHLDLVVPYGLDALHNPVNLRLLKRHAEFLGLQMRVISRDATTRNLFQDEGFAVRASDRALPALLAPEVVRNQKSYAAYIQDRTERADRLRMLKTLGLAALVVAVLLPLLGALFYFPSATVTLRFASHPVDEVVLVTASALASNSDVSTLRIPARELQTPFEVTAIINTSGVRKDAQTKAQGLVILSNRSTNPVDVPSGLRVATATNIEFVTQRAVLVPASPTAKVPVAVVAVNSGSGGNVAAGTVTRVLDPLLARALSVTNEQLIEGGTDNVTPVLGEQDILQLREQALVLAREDAVNRLDALRGTDISFYKESVRIRTTNEELDRKVGEEATQAAFKLQGTARVLAFNGHDVNEVIRRYLEQENPSYKLSGDLLNIRALEAVTYDSDSIAFRIGVKGSLSPQFSEEQVKEQIKGKKPADAASVLAEQFPLAGRPDVITAPFWVDTVPQYSWRITIRQLPAR